MFPYKFVMLFTTSCSFGTHCSLSSVFSALAHMVFLMSNLTLNLKPPITCLEAYSIVCRLKRWVESDMELYFEMDTKSGTFSSSESTLISTGQPKQGAFSGWMWASETKSNQHKNSNEVIFCNLDKDAWITSATNYFPCDIYLSFTVVETAVLCKATSHDFYLNESGCKYRDNTA